MVQKNHSVRENTKRFKAYSPSYLQNKMFFNNKNTERCKNCEKKIDRNSSYCPKCGYPQNQERKQREYGLLGSNDYENLSEHEESEPFGITDKIINSMVNSLMKSLDKQFKFLDEDSVRKMQKDLQNAEIQSFPNGIRIRVTPQPQKSQKLKKKSILEKSPNSIQLKKLSTLPRTKAKGTIKRLNDSLNYELTTPGVDSIEDIFVSKLEEGYEIKAIGNKKIYTNSLPINLPLKKLSLIKDKLLVEFRTDE